MKLLSQALLIVALASSANLLAQEDSHQHGIAELNLVLDQSTLMIEFESPAANIVGFEHEAVTATETAAIAAAITKLEKPQNLMSLPTNADCKPQGSEVELHSEHQAGEENTEQDAEEHEEGHETGHSEFHAVYTFTCTQSHNLSEIPLLYFQLFPALEEIHLQAISPWGQIGGEINAKDAVIRLK